MNNEQKTKIPIVLGITGASGSIYGFNLLKFFLTHDFKVELVISNNAVQVAKEELALNLDSKNPDLMKNQILDFIAAKDFSENLKIWEQGNIAASISSGSYKTQGMIIAPCSMGTVANIAAGSSNNLITRAADVIIKERRKLILVIRETPLSSIHLRNMCSLSEMGVIILPAAPGFYHHPKTIDDQVNFVLGKTLDVFGLDNSMFKRWMNK